MVIFNTSLGGNPLYRELIFKYAWICDS